MDTELGHLYRVLSFYKTSMVEILEKIDDVLLQAVREHVSSSHEKKLQLSMEMLNVLQQYIHILYKTEDTSQKLISNFSDLQRDIEPERDQASGTKPDLIELTVDETNNSHYEAAALEPKIEPQGFWAEEIKLDNEEIQEKEVEAQLEVPKVELKAKQGKKVNFVLASEDKFDKKPNFDWRYEAEELFANQNKRKNFKTKNEHKSKAKVPDFDDELTRQSCYFSHIESPSKFYVRTNHELLQGLENALNEDMNSQSFTVVNKYKSKAHARSSLGKFCFVYLAKHKKWFRVEVVNWLEKDKDNVSVLLIDYGETLTCHYSCLKPMTELYSVFPKMAVRCHLAGIYSPNLHCKTKWPKACCNFLKELAEIPKQTKFLIIYVHKEGDSYAIDLQKDSNSDTVGQILVQKGYAFEVSITDNADSDEEFDNLNEAVAGYDAKDEARLCPFTDQSGRCFKGPSCRLEHGRLSADGVTSDKVVTSYDALMKFPLPAEGQEIKVLVTGYVSTCRFYVNILLDGWEGLTNRDFAGLKEGMSASNVVGGFEKFKVYPGVGELALVREGAHWLRGRCVGHLGEDVEVFIVDFGYKVVRHWKKLRVMKDDFLHVPFQAVECVLSNCQERRDLDRDVSKEFFDKFMFMRAFPALVKEAGEPLRLQLRDRDWDFSYVLQQYGIGLAVKNDRYPSKNSVLSCE